MELIQYWRLIVQNRLIIAFTTLSGLFLAFGLTMTITPLYQSEAEIFVSTPVSNLDITELATGSSFSQQRVKSYAQIINSPVTLKPVVSRLGLNLSPEQLSGQISASAPLDTVLITLSVIDTRPDMAAKIANAVAEQFGITVSDLELHGIGIDSPVKVSVVKDAIPNGNPISPNRILNYGIGLILGFALGVGIGYLRRVADNTVKNEDDLQGLPLLAAIGFDHDADEKPLVTQIGRYSARTEAFRTLRTNIQFLMPKKHPQVIVLTSAFPSEGKTTSSINLALSLTHTGSCVVLVEADLRRPKVAQYLEFSDMSRGLADIISGTSDISLKTVKSVVRKFEGSELDVIPAGKIPQNPAELLSSKKFDLLIDLLRKKYEYVIIDCPPILPVTDAAIVSTRADGALIVVHAGMTKRPHFNGTRDALKAVGTEILGVIINKIPNNVAGYEYGYRYGYSGYYGGYYRPRKSEPLELSEYPPHSIAVAGQKIEENFRHIKGQRFKEELKHQDSKKS